MSKTWRPHNNKRIPTISSSLSHKITKIVLLSYHIILPSSCSGFLTLRPPLHDQHRPLDLQQSPPITQTQPQAQIGVIEDRSKWESSLSIKFLLTLHPLLFSDHLLKSMLFISVVLTNSTLLHSTPLQSILLIFPLLSSTQLYSFFPSSLLLNLAHFFPLLFYST